MAKPIPINNFSSVLALGHTIGDGILSLRPGAGALLLERLAAMGVDDVTEETPIRVMAAARKKFQGNVVVPTTTFTIFHATGRSGDDLTPVAAVEGTADENYAVDDPVAATVTADMLMAPFAIRTLLDSEAVDGELFFGSEHLDGNGLPQLCRKQGLAVTVIG